MYNGSYVSCVGAIIGFSKNLGCKRSLCTHAHGGRPCLYCKPKIDLSVLCDICLASLVQDSSAQAKLKLH